MRAPWDQFFNINLCNGFHYLVRELIPNHNKYILIHPNLNLLGSNGLQLDLMVYDNGQEATFFFPPSQLFYFFLSNNKSSGNDNSIMSNA